MYALHEVPLHSASPTTLKWSPRSLYKIWLWPIQNVTYLRAYLFATYEYSRRIWTLESFVFEQKNSTKFNRQIRQLYAYAVTHSTSVSGPEYLVTVFDNYDEVAQFWRVWFCIVWIFWVTRLQLRVTSCAIVFGFQYLVSSPDVT